MECIMSYSAEESSPVASFESCCVCDAEFFSDSDLAVHLINHANDEVFKASLTELEQKHALSTTGTSRNLPTKQSLNKQSPLKRNFTQRSTSPEVWEIISDESGDESTKSKTPKLSNSFRLVTNSSDNSQQSNKTQHRSNNIQQQPNTVQRPNNVQQKPNNAQQKPNNVQQKPINAQQKPNNAQQKPNNAQQKPNNVQQKLNNVQQGLNNAQHRPNNGQQRLQRSNSTQQQSNNVQWPSNVQNQSNITPQPSNNAQQTSNNTPQSNNMAAESGPPFNCPTCKMVLQDVKSYKEHLKTHERSYSCQICNKKFAHKGTLRQHLHKHIGEKAYECKICHKKFSMKKMLLQHEETHEQVKPQGRVNDKKK